MTDRSALWGQSSVGRALAAVGAGVLAAAALLSAAAIAGTGPAPVPAAVHAPLTPSTLPATGRMIQRFTAANMIGSFAGTQSDAVDLAKAYDVISATAGQFGRYLPAMRAANSKLIILGLPERHDGPEESEQRLPGLVVPLQQQRQQGRPAIRQPLDGPDQPGMDRQPDPDVCPTHHRGLRRLLRRHAGDCPAPAGLPHRPAGRFHHRRDLYVDRVGGSDRQGRWRGGRSRYAQVCSRQRRVQWDSVLRSDGPHVTATRPH